MELKVNDYVRYVRSAINGYAPQAIAKIKEIVSKELIKLDNQQVIMNNDVIKSSSNIIDLIEVGDYVNGFKVKKTMLKCDKTIKVLITDYMYDICECNIQSVITKEQFESMSYKVEEWWK